MDANCIHYFLPNNGHIGKYKEVKKEIHMGKIIVIDGMDGSGKHTQSEMLLSRLKEDGYNVQLISFPRYGQTSSALVDLYLHGHICEDPMKVNPYAAASFYALDRYISYEREWKAWHEKKNSIIIFDRYATANVLHQTPKVEDCYREEFIDWVYDYEYNTLGLPKPNIEFYLSVPTKTNVELMRSRQSNSSAQVDIHENKSFQTICHECFDSLKDSKLSFLNIVECCDEAGVMKDRTVINEMIINTLESKNIII